MDPNLDRRRHGEGLQQGEEVEQPVSDQLEESGGLEDPLSDPLEATALGVGGAPAAPDQGGGSPDEGDEQTEDAKKSDGGGGGGTGEVGGTGDPKKGEGGTLKKGSGAKGPLSSEEEGEDSQESTEEQQGEQKVDTTDETQQGEEPEQPEVAVEATEAEEVSFEAPPLVLPDLPKISKSKEKRLTKKTGLNASGHHAKVQSEYVGLSGLAQNAFSSLQVKAESLSGAAEGWLDGRAGEGTAKAQTAASNTSAAGELNRQEASGLAETTRGLIAADATAARKVVREIASKNLGGVAGSRKKHVKEIRARKVALKETAQSNRDQTEEDFGTRKTTVETAQTDKASELKEGYGDSGSYLRRALNEETRKLIDTTSGIAVEKVGETADGEMLKVDQQLTELLQAVENQMADSAVHGTADSARSSIQQIRGAAIKQVGALEKGSVEQVDQAETQTLTQSKELEGELLERITAMHCGVDELIGSEKKAIRQEIRGMAPAQAAALEGVLQAGVAMILGSQVDPTSRKGTGDTDKVLDSHDLKAESANPEPLPYQGEMERAFGMDLSGVDAFTGQQESLNAQGADAAALGNTVSFGSSSPSKELVGHELAHVLQGEDQVQHHGAGDGGAAETEANQVGAAVARGERVQVSRRARGVQRKPKKRQSASGGGLVRHDIVAPVFVQLRQQIQVAYGEQNNAMTVAVQNAQVQVDEILAALFGEIDFLDMASSNAFGRLSLGMRQQIEHIGQELRTQLDGVAGSVQGPASSIVRTLGPSLLRLIDANEKVAKINYVKVRETDWDAAEKSYEDSILAHIKDNYPTTISEQFTKLEQSVPTDLNDRAYEIYKACNGAGTDEAKVFKNLQNLTFLKGRHLQYDTYKYEGYTIREWLKGDLGGSGWKSAQAYLRGDQSKGAFHAYDYATPWYTTHDELIETTSKGLDKKSLEKLMDTEGWGDLSSKIEGRLDGYQKEAWKKLSEGNLEGMWAGYLKDGIDEARDDKDFEKVLAEMKEVPAELRDKVSVEFAKMVTDFDAKLAEAKANGEEVDETELAKQIVVDDANRDITKMVYVQDGHGGPHGGGGGHYEEQTFGHSQGQKNMVDGLWKNHQIVDGKWVGGEHSAQFEAASIGYEIEQAKTLGSKYKPGTAWDNVGNAEMKNLPEEEREEAYKARYAEVMAAFAEYYDGGDPETELSEALKKNPKSLQPMLEQMKTGACDPVDALLALAKDPNYKLEDLQKLMAGLKHSTMEKLFKENPGLEQKILAGKDGRKGWDREIALFGTPTNDREYYEITKLRWEKSRTGDTGYGAQATGKELDKAWEKCKKAVGGRPITGEGAAFDKETGKLIPLPGQERVDFFDATSGAKNLYTAYLDQKEDDANFWKTVIAVAAAIIAAPFTGGASLALVAANLAIALAATALTYVVTDALMGDAFGSDERQDMWVEGISSAVTGALLQRINLAGKLFPKKFANELLTKTDDVIVGAVEGYSSSVLSKSIEQSFKSDGKGFFHGLKEGAIDGVPNALGGATTKYVKHTLPKGWDDSIAGKSFKEGISGVGGNVVKQPVQTGFDAVFHGKKDAWDGFLENLATSSFVEFVQNAGGTALSESKGGKNITKWTEKKGSQVKDFVQDKYEVLGSVFKGNYGGSSDPTDSKTDIGETKKLEIQSQVTDDGSQTGEVKDPKKVKKDLVKVLNDGSEKELKSLDGIGDKKARLIVEERKNGDYTSIHEASDRVKGLGETVATKLDDQHRTDDVVTTGSDSSDQTIVNVGEDGLPIVETGGVSDDKKKTSGTEDDKRRLKKVIHHDDEKKSALPKHEDSSIKVVGTGHTDDGAQTGPVAGKSLLDKINNADFAELCALPGIGKKKARMILKHIEEHGPFGSINAMEKIDGLGKKVVHALAAHEKLDFLDQSDFGQAGALRKTFESDLQQMRKMKDYKNRTDLELMKLIVQGKGPSKFNMGAMGDVVPQSTLEQKGAMTRVVGMEAVFKYHLTESAKKQLAGEGIVTSKDFAKAMKKDSGLLTPDMIDSTTEVSGQNQVAWWTPKAESAANTAAELIEQLALNPNWYEGGCVQFTVNAQDAVGKFKKPTVYDGMLFGEWVNEVGGATLGVTRGGAEEAVAKPISIGDMSELKIFT